MALIESWFNQDLKEAVKVHYLDGNVFSADNAGNLIGVNMFSDGEPASLGGSIAANVIRADGATVAVSGALSGNKATVVLNQSCYAVPGPISIVIKLTASGAVTTICAVVANVYRSSTDTVIDPGTIIPSVETLIAAIEAAVASIPADYSDLWTSLAPAYSNSNIYSVGQYVTYNGGLYRCIIPIPSAESWTSAHWAAVKLGPDISSLVSTLGEYYAPDYLLGLRNKESYSGNGITWTYIDDALVKVNGTPSAAIISRNIYSNISGFPVGVSAGGKAKVMIKGANKTEVSWYYYQGSSWNLGGSNVKNNDVITIPSSATGFLIRLEVYQNKGAISNEVIYVGLTDENALTVDSLYEYINGNAMINKGVLENADANDCLENGCWRIPDNANVLHLPFDGTQGTLVVFRGQVSFVQVYFSYYSVGNVFMRRGFTTNPSAVSDWVIISLANGMVVPNGTDLNNWIQDGHFYLNAEYSYQNAPVSGGYLENIRVANGVVLQRVTAGNLSNVYIRRLTNSVWSAWVDISGDAINKHWKLAMCGDSITWGRNGSGSGQVSETIPIIVSKTRDITAVNYGYGSMGWISTQYRSERDTALDVVQSYIDYTGVNAISYMFGTNDCGDPNVSVGSYLDTTDGGSLMGRIYTCMKYVADNHPGITQILIGIPNLDYGSFPSYCWNDIVFADNKSRKDFNDEMRKFAEYYQIPFIDLSKGGITSFNISNLIGDHVHPTQAGYYALGGYISGQLESVLGE